MVFSCFVAIRDGLGIAHTSRRDPFLLPLLEMIIGSIVREYLKPVRLMDENRHRVILESHFRGICDFV
jgi:hypothetical protein